LATNAMCAALIPLPPLSSHHATPESFGTPLTVGGWSNSQDAWLSINPIKFILPFRRLVRVNVWFVLIKCTKIDYYTQFKRMMPPVTLSDLELSQIECYCTTLLMTNTGSDMRQGPSGGGSGV
jgi:hypothetical protein